MGFAGSCTVFFHVLEFFLWKAGRHICNAPWHKNKNKKQKRDQNEIKTRPNRDQNEIKTKYPLPHPLFDSISHLRTPAAQPAQPCAHTRQPNGKHPRSSTPAQRCQIISTPSSPPAQPCKHARLVQVRGKARCRLEPAVAKETSSLKIAKHTVNAPRRIR